MNKVDTQHPGNGRGERKQITAVFIDLVGFSNIASTADAEDLQQWLDGYYQQSRDIIEAHDGEITEYLGDGVVALFGLERADELAAAKAVNAALRAVSQINADYRGGIEIQMRAGVATGEAAVRAAGGNNPLPRATGMVTTLAQRIQELAEPGTVLLSESTQSLLRGSIDVTKFSDQMLKGFNDAQTLYRPSADGVRPRTLSPAFFVGRTAEREVIIASDLPCLIVGQAGIGKTALSRFVSADASSVSWFSADGVHTRASYQPFKDWIVRQVGKTLQKFDEIETCFSAIDPDAQRCLALIIGLPEGQRLLVERSNVALKGLIEKSLWEAIRSKQTDGLLIFEDLHWLDNASFEVLRSILGNPDAADYQILMTSREDTKIGQYLGDLDVKTIPLDPFDEHDANGMLDALDQSGVEKYNRKSLIEKAGGIPLFIEQLFKRSIAPSGEVNKIPGTLMDLLAERIDATGPSKPILQGASVIGRTFDLGMLRSVTPDDDTLIHHLDAACDRGVLQRVGEQSWIFSHALLHQAAYQGLLRKTRIAQHAKIAAHLQENHPDTVARNPALLADHQSAAQQYVPAIQNYLAASQWALFQGAFADAESHINAAIALCSEAPADLDVTDLEIACYTALGSVMMQVQGFTAEPVKRAFDAVRKLAEQQSTHSGTSAPALFGSFSHAIISGNKPSADTFCNLLVDTAAQVVEGPVGAEVRLAALAARNCSAFYHGDFSTQFEQIAAIRERYDLSKHGAMIANYGMDIFAAAQMFEPVARAITGDANCVSELIVETDAHQDCLNIPVMRPYALIWGAVPIFYAGDTAGALERLKSGLVVADEQAAAFWQLTGAAWLHIMEPSQSDSAEGLAAFGHVVQMHEAIGANIGRPYFKAHYAIALARNGQLDEAYRTSTAAVRESEQSGLHCWHAETIRLHADVCRQSERRSEAAQMLAIADHVANRQSASLWRLRTALDQYNMQLVDRDHVAAALAELPADTILPEASRAREVVGAG